MKRINTLADALTTGRVTVDADGIEVELAPNNHIHGSLDRGANRLFLDSTGGIHQSVGGVSTLTFDHTGKMSRGSVPPGSVDGLQDRLAALEYDSGIRDLTAHLLSSDWVADRVLLTRTPGHHVTLTVSNLRRVDTQSSSVFYALPRGFRPTAMPSLPRSFYGLVGSGNPPRTAQMDIDEYGNLRLFVNVGDAPVTGTLTWGTPDTIPTTLPGTPA